MSSPSHDLIYQDLDVLVVGGGPAGTGAGLAEARLGAKTLAALAAQEGKQPRELDPKGIRLRLKEQGVNLE